MRRLTVYISILTLVFAIASKCEDVGAVNRNSIRFKDPVKTVEEKLKMMNNLMGKILAIDGEMQNYFFDDSSGFYINSQKIGRIDSLKTGSVEIFKNLTVKETDEFTSTVIFLKNNYLSSTFLDKSCNCYLYGYHQIDDPSYKNDRLIYLNEKNKDYQTILTDREILDKKGNLVLIGVR